MPKSKVIGILGATNTGKTFSAISRMFNFKNGVIGFPLRLLARENFEKAQKIVGKDKVALITGEEKIIPKNAEFYFCTVEAMPLSKFEFLAVDEVQLAANYERGHHFTEKILFSRGTKETLFLGSISMKKILLSLIPSIKIVSKNRLSELNFFGYKNITRLPKRSAIIAFSQIDVYLLAEKIKKFKGGVSIVTGALSPDARNKQVDLYEKGDVDYIVATDAIGLGLNLNINYLFFTSLIKFDGKKRRYLTFDEISQIAGRAGRFKNKGFFGVTENLKKMSSELIEHIQEHKYIEINNCYWRNSKLNFSSINNLLKSLLKKPRHKFLMLQKNSDDINSLINLSEDKKVLNFLKSSEDLKLLWEICSVPNYTKNLVDYHTKLLKKIIFYLIIKRTTIPKFWIIGQINQIKKLNDKISVINQKLSQIRIWSYISYKKNWINNSEDLQRNIKKIEEILSNKIHENLIKKFVDENYDNKDYGKNLDLSKFLEVKNFKEIYINKKLIAKLQGFSFIFSREVILKKKEVFFKKQLKEKINTIVNEVTKKFLNEDFSNIKFCSEGKIYWHNKFIGFFCKGQKIDEPEIKIVSDHYFGKENNQSIYSKLKDFFYFLKKKYYFSYLKIINESKKNCYSNSFRAISFALLENFGYCPKKTHLEFYNNLNKKELLFFKNLGLVNGSKFLYLKNTNSKSLIFTKMLVCIYLKIRLEKTLVQKSFFNEDFVKNNKQPDNLIRLMGFFKLKIFNRVYVINYLLYENLINALNYYKKKKIPVPKNILNKCGNDNYFLENFLKRKHLIIY